jgi:lysophospholipase L1-like esterase
MNAPSPGALIVLLAASLAGCPAAEEPARKPPATAASSASVQRAAVAAPSAPVLLHLESAQAAPSPPPAPAPSAAPPPPTGEKRVCRVAALGDSLTDYRSHGGGFLRHLEKRCPQSEFENFGKGGDMVNQMRRRFEAQVLPEPASRFTHVVVFGGVNDLYSDETAGRTPQKIERDLGAIYEGARSKGWRVVALTVAPWGGFQKWFTPKRSAATQEVNTWIKSSGVETVVDAYALLSCGAPERLCPEVAKPHKDGLHFGKLGHEKLGAALYEAEFASCR